MFSGQEDDDENQPAESGDSFDNSVMAAQDFVETAFPNYDIVRTIDVDMNRGVPDTIKYLPESGDGTQVEAKIDVTTTEDGNYELHNTSLLNMEDKA